MTDRGAPEDAAAMLEGELDSSASLIAAMRADTAMRDAAARVAGVVTDAYRSGGKVILFGNGGSAADSVHIAAEFVGRFLTDRRPLPALSLAANLSAITAIGNDYGFEKVFARQLEALGEEGDVAIGLSTSGQSENVIRGFEYAATAGISSVALTGMEPRGAGQAAEHVIAIPSTATPDIQQGHMLVAHFICGWVEHDLLAGRI